MSSVEDHKIYRVDPMNFSDSKLKEEEQYTSIVAENSSITISIINFFLPLCLVIIARHL